IVVVPFLLLRASEDRLRDAEALVARTLQIETNLHAASAALRNIEAASLSRALGAEAPLLDERQRTSHDMLEPLLDQIQDLTRDSPAQQVRLGVLRQSIDQRIEQIDRLLLEDGEPDHAELQRLIEHFPVQGPITEMVAAQRELLALRTADATRVRRQADWLSGGTMLAQVLLLVGLAWLATRDADRRTRAETASQRANLRAAAVLDTVREPIVLLDERLQVVMYNTAFGELFGLDEDARGRPLSAIGGGAWDDVETLRRLRDVGGRGRELWDYELRQRTADGLER